MTRRDYEYIVLGLGGIGSAAAYWLSRRAGRDVLGLEQFELGHVRGESQDHSRIIRLSYHAPNYVRLAMRAYESWAQVSADAKEDMVLETGGLDFGPVESAIPLSTYMQAMDACGVPYEHLQAQEIRHRWPQFQVGDGIHGIYQEKTGLAKAAIANAAHQRLAREHGATLLDRTPVKSFREVHGEIEVVTEAGPFRCRRLVVAGGPWSNRALEHAEIKLPLQVTQEQVTYFASPHTKEFEPGRFPTWIWMDDPCYYGFPVFGEFAVKVAQDAGGKPVTADTRTFEPDPENFARVEGWMKQYLPTGLGPVLYTKTCLYTLTPDRDFVIDRLPSMPAVACAIGAGHAFKFASVIGRILSELSIDETTPSDIGAFKVDRPILQMENPPVSYMV